MNSNNCPKCNSTRLAVAHVSSVERHDRVYLGAADGWQCLDCLHHFGVQPSEPDVILPLPGATGLD